MTPLELAYPWFLLLLVPLGCGMAWRWFCPPPAIAVSSVAVFRPPGRHASGLLRSRVLLGMECTALALGIVALARPQTRVEIRPATREGVDIMIALDLSNSMDAYDAAAGLTPREIEAAIDAGEIHDRLRVAADQIQRFILRRPGDRIGLSVFGTRAWIAAPPTLDHDFLVASVNQIADSPLGRLERGTNIAGGLATAIAALPEVSDSRRCIILITDGAPTVVDPEFTTESAARLAAALGIAVHSIGIGSDTPFTREGSFLRGLPGLEFRTDTIEEISAISHGLFFRARDNAAFESCMDLIDQLETTSRIHPAVVFRGELFHLPLSAATALFGLALLLGQTLLHSIA